MFRAAVLEEVTNNKNICSAVLLTFVFAMHSESQSQCGFLLSLLQRRKPIAAAAAHDILCVCVSSLNEVGEAMYVVTIGLR